MSGCGCAILSSCFIIDTALTNLHRCAVPFGLAEPRLPASVGSLSSGVCRWTSWSAPVTAVRWSSHSQGRSPVTLHRGDRYSSRWPPGRGVAWPDSWQATARVHLVWHSMSKYMVWPGRCLITTNKYTRISPNVRFFCLIQLTLKTLH